MLNLATGRCGTGQVRRRVLLAVVTPMALALVACGDSSGPPDPGSLLVMTQTSGFLKPTGYQLTVTGETPAAIGANDQVTVSGLSPGSYTVELTGVPDNCTAQSHTVDVTSKETTGVTLTVSCSHEAPTAYTLQFTRQRPDLDSGAITICAFGICPSNDDWDLYVHNATSGEYRAVIRQNQTGGVEIAHVTGVTLASLTEAHVQGANFTTALLSDPFVPTNVILIRSDMGNVYALANPVENLINGTLAVDVALVARP